MYHPAVNDLWSQIYAPLRRRQHRSAYDGCWEWGHYKSNNKFLLRCSEVIFLGLLTMYVPILYLPTFSESNAWDFHLVMTGIFENLPLRGDFRRFPMTFRRLPNVAEMPTDVPKTFELLKVAQTDLFARWLCFWIGFFGRHDLTDFYDLWHP